MVGVCCTRVLLLLLALMSYSARSIFGQCAGNYSLSCSNVQLEGTSTLQASCQEGYGGFETTQLNLDEHITNNNGNLECSSGGGDFSASCRSISLTASNVLSANCFDIAGNLVSASVDLDQCVQNNGGRLAWACV